MIVRSLTAGLLCLFLIPTASGQADRRPAQRGRAAAGDLAAVQRHLADLQKQLATLTREIEALGRARSTQAAPPAAKVEVRVFPLRDAEPVEMVQTLKELFAEEGKVRIVAHAGSNSIIVRGEGGDLEAIEAVIQRLDALGAEMKKARPAPQKKVAGSPEGPARPVVK